MSRPYQNNFCIYICLLAVSLFRFKRKIRFLGMKCIVVMISLSFCYLCNMKTLTKPCPTCNKPTCKNCMKDFPFSDSACLDCATGIKTGLGGTRKDEEIF